MRLVLRAAIITAFCFWGSGAWALLRGSPSAGVPVADVVCTITTGNCTGTGGGSSLFTAATCNGDGVTDDAAAFRSFRTWAVSTWQASHTGLVQLTVPNGAVCQFISGLALTNAIGEGILRFQIVGYGAEFNDNVGTGGGFALGTGLGIGFDGTDSTVRLATVTSGASCVDLLDAAKITLWSAGVYALISGIDPQGFGDPPNPIIFEWPKVLSTSASLKCDGVTSGASVRFTAPLANTYKSTWPLYNVGRPGLNSDQGGPATLYKLNSSWDAVQAYYGLTIRQEANQTNSTGRDITLQDMTCPIGFCVIPSQNLTWRMINVISPSSTMEIDKIVTNVVMENIAFRRLIFQSAPVSQTWTCDRCVIGPVGVGGTAGTSIITNSTIDDWSIGAIAYGASGSTTVSNSTIGALSVSGASQNHINTRGVWSGGTFTVPHNIHIASAANNGSGLIRLTIDSDGGTAGWTTGVGVDGPEGTDCSGYFIVTVIDATHLDFQGSTFVGTCSGSIGSLPLTWAIPAAGSSSGANVFFSGSSSGSPGGPLLQVNDLTVGPNNETIVTFYQNGAPYAGGFPTMPGGPAWSIFAHPAPSWSCTACSGPLNVSDVTGVPVGPFGSQATRVVTAANSRAAPMFVFGPLHDISMTVTAACSGVSTVGLEQPAFIATVGSSSATGFWNPRANAQITSGTPRIVTPTTSSGAQSGDSLTPPGVGTILLTGQTSPEYSNAANCATAATTLTVKTDQGVVFP